MVCVLVVLFLAFIAVKLFLNINPVFGGRASKEEKINYAKRVGYYVKEQFVFPSEYATEVEVYDNRISLKEKSPKEGLPIVKPDLNKTSIDELKVTWFGHSNLLVQIHGMNILFDPVFSKRASPFSFAGPKRFSEPPITIEELPKIDVVIISHNHYDHLDMDSIKKLDHKVDKYIVPLGVERDLERWHVDKSKIQNMEWWEETEVNGLKIVCTPARHFSNRQFDWLSTLYASWVLKDDYHQVFESGDGGFGSHFEEIHKRYGDFDLALMECGQYNMKWRRTHMFPEQSAAASKILGAKLSMPIHWGVYVLAYHGWDDSVERFVRASKKNGNEVITPKIGETVSLDKYKDYQEKWWHEVE